MKLGKAKQRQATTGKGLAKQQIAVAWHGRDKKNGDLNGIAKAEKRIGLQRNSKAVNGKIMICKGFDMKGNGDV